jgi:hypothetical protein
MRQKAGARATSFDRAGRQRRLGEGIAARTGHAWADNSVHDEPSRHIFQLLGHILSETAQPPAALGTIIVTRGQFDLLTRNVIRDRPALGLVLGLLVRQPQPGGHRRRGDLTVLQRQLQLLNALGGCAEAV